MSSRLNDVLLFRFCLIRLDSTSNFAGDWNATSRKYSIQCMFQFNELKFKIVALETASRYVFAKVFTSLHTRFKLMWFGLPARRMFQLVCTLTVANSVFDLKFNGGCGNWITLCFEATKLINFEPAMRNTAFNFSRIFESFYSAINFRFYTARHINCWLIHTWLIWLVGGTVDRNVRRRPLCWSIWVCFVWLTCLCYLHVVNRTITATVWSNGIQKTIAFCWFTNRIIHASPTLLFGLIMRFWIPMFTSSF